MIRLADYVTQTLVRHGIDQVFLIPGGLAMHLNDAVGLNKSLKYTCCHHEQACAMAAEGYARVTNKPAVVQVTGGPGGINTLNGVFGAYTDSLPMLVITGQAKRETCVWTYGLSELRQLGDQEVAIADMARGITKYTVCVDDPQTIRYHLERAIHLCTHRRPGPCWLDIPVDVQSTMIDEDMLPAYEPAEDAMLEPDPALLRSQVANILHRLKQAERPVILVGTGVRLSGMRDLFEKTAETLGIPVTLGFTATDTLPTDHPLNCGRPGTVGDRPGNFVVQNADLVLVLGCRLNIRQVSYNWANFARSAYKIQVDVDPAELLKPTVKPDLGVCADLRHFLPELARQAGEKNFTHPNAAKWLSWCHERVTRFPGVTERQRTTGKLNPYPFIEAVIASMGEDEIIVCGDATAHIVPQQVGFLKRGMRLFGNSGSASMGYDIPAAIGAAIAGGGKRVVCFAGDGSAQLNIQELETIKFNKLPIKIFILNNGGYLSMRLTQGGFFKGNFIGEAPRSGISFPDYAALAAAYGLPAMRIESADFAGQLAKFMAIEGPALCEVMLDHAQEFEPKLTSRRLDDGTLATPALEDMAPFLDREEFAANMIVPPA